MILPAKALFHGQGAIEGIALAYCIAFPEGGGEYIQRVGQVMPAAVVGVIGHQGGAQQRQGQLTPVGTDAVAAVVQHGKTAVVLAQGGIAVVADLVAVGGVAGGAMGRARNVAELDFMQRFLGKEIAFKVRLEHAPTFVPVDIRVKVHPTGGGVKPERLHRGAAAKAALNP